MRAFLAFICFLSIGCGKKNTKMNEQVPLAISLMDCVTNTAGMFCQGIDPNRPNGIPNGCVFYTQGTREFLNGTLTSTMAYDCGYHYNGLRCFYFQHEPNDDELIEDLVCKKDYS